MERELARVKSEHEARDRELKELKDKLEFDRDIYRQRVKDHYEDKSYVRKESSEAVKFIPGIIVGIGAIFMAMRSIFSGSGGIRLV